MSKQRLAFLIAIIAVASVIVMFIWNMVAPGSPSWIAPMIGGLGILIAIFVSSKDNSPKG